MDSEKFLNGILNKVNLLYVVFGLALIAIIVAILFIQNGDDAKRLQTRGEAISFSYEEIKAERGNILSDDGRILATSYPQYELRWDFVFRGSVERDRKKMDSIYKRDIDALCTELSRFYGDASPAQYKKRIEEARAKANASFRINIRRINYLELQKLLTFPIFREKRVYSGLEIKEFSHREYPYNLLAKKSIGYRNEIGGAEGIESSFDHYLRGVDGTRLMQKVSGNFRIPVVSETNVEPERGANVVTTFNVELQEFVQNALCNWVAEQDAEWGSVVVLEAATAQVKALANADKEAGGVVAEKTNHIVSDIIEPGSTFKVASMIVLMEDAGVSIYDNIDAGVGAKEFVNGTAVSEAAGRRYGVISMQRAIEKSSNLAFARMVDKHYRTNPARFVDAVYNLNLLGKLSLQLPVEASQLYNHPIRNKRDWSPSNLVTMSYGYGISFPMIRIAALYNALANNGVMLKPQFIKEVILSQDSVIRFAADTLSPRICSPKTLADIRGAMELVTGAEGTARSIRTDKYRIAAKTGTSRESFGRRGYADENGLTHFNASIAGFFPADNPQYTIYVVMHTKRQTNNGGGSLAAPLFKQVSDFIYRREIEPSRTLAQNINGDKRLTVKGETAKAATIVRDMNVAQMVNYRNDSIKKGGVLGYPLDEALAKLEGAGYRVEAAGRGVVVEQRIDSIRRLAKIFLQ